MAAGPGAEAARFIEPHVYPPRLECSNEVIGPRPDLGQNSCKDNRGPSALNPTYSAQGLRRL